MFLVELLFDDVITNDTVVFDIVLHIVVDPDAVAPYHLAPGKISVRIFTFKCVVNSLIYK